MNCPISQTKIYVIATFRAFRQIMEKQIGKIYKFSYQYLIDISKDSVSKEKIDQFIKQPDKRNCNCLEDAFDLLLDVLQDFNRNPNVIKYRTRSQEIKRHIEFPNLQHISLLNPSKLSADFATKFDTNGTRCWENYCKGIVSGAKFLLNFKSYGQFKKLCKSFNKNVMTREAFALLLKEKINNMGFAIACNWLKELGYYNYPKPDTHMKDICLTLKLIDNREDELGCFEAMSNIAKAAHVRPYMLDKVWWLICTGDFYRYDIKLQIPSKKLKNDFLKALKYRFT